jgi:hypothetical protein
LKACGAPKIKIGQLAIQHPVAGIWSFVLKNSKGEFNEFMLNKGLSDVVLGLVLMGPTLRGTIASEVNDWTSRLRSSGRHSPALAAI